MKSFRSKTLFSFLLFLISIFGYSQVPVLTWTKQIGGLNFDDSQDVVVDATGNVYSIVRFEGTSDFDPGPNVFNLISAGGLDMVVLKLDANGKFVWARQFASASDNEGNALTVDAAGNVYAVGGFLVKIDVDPGPAVNEIFSNGNYDFFVVKLDPNGVFQWAKKYGGADWDAAIDIKIDNSNNIIVCGIFSQKVDFGNSILLNSNGLIDAFVLKLDATGATVWAKQFGGTEFDYADALALDKNGNVYMAGEFKGTADFDPGLPIQNLTSNGGYDTFIVKLTSSGNLNWFQQIGGIGDDQGSGIALDASNNVFVSGSFELTIDLNPGTGVNNFTAVGPGLSGQNDSDDFVLKLDANGNYSWAGVIIGTQNLFSLPDIATDPFGNVYLMNNFKDKIDLNPDVLLASDFVTTSNSNSYIAKLDNAGAYQWGKIYGGFGPTNFVQTRNIFVAANNEINSVGLFNPSADFDPPILIIDSKKKNAKPANANSVILNSFGDNDAFTLKIGANGPLPIQIVSFSVKSVEGKNILKWETSAEQNSAYFLVEKSQDSFIFETIGQIKAFGNSIEKKQYELIDKNPEDGVGYYRLKSVDLNGKFTYSKIISVINQLNNISISSNPSNGLFQLYSTEKLKFASIYVTDLTGRKVVELSSENQNTVSIDLRNEPDGIYFLQIVEAGKTQNIKIMIRK
jgi:hypothetical protein